MHTFFEFLVFLYRPVCHYTKLYHQISQNCRFIYKLILLKNLFLSPYIFLNLRFPREKSFEMEKVVLLLRNSDIFANLFFDNCWSLSLEIYCHRGIFWLEIIQKKLIPDIWHFALCTVVYSKLWRLWGFPGVDVVFYPEPEVQQQILVAIEWVWSLWYLKITTLKCYRVRS